MLSVIHLYQLVYFIYKLIYCLGSPACVLSYLFMHGSIASVPTVIEGLYDQLSAQILPLKTLSRRPSLFIPGCHLRPQQTVDGSTRRGGGSRGDGPAASSHFY